MRNEHGQSVDLEQEPMMTRALGVVAQQLRHRARSDDGDVTGVRTIGVGKLPRFLIALREQQMRQAAERGAQ
jgi:hypothetical protein